MNIGISFVEATLIYLLIIAVVYFIKPRIKTYENNLYSTLLIISIIGCIIAIPTYYLVKDYSNYNFFTFLIPRLYLVYLMVWVFFMMIYLIVLCRYSDNNINNDKVFKYFILYFLLVQVISFLFPINYFSKNDVIYTYGPAVNATFILCGVQLLYMIIACIRNFKVLKSKKVIPIIFVFILGSISFIIQKIDPSIRLMTFVIALDTIIMYFTIENPDVKMIKQLEVARDQADKANRAKTDFLSSMSHEIRTPLNAIVGFSDCIMDAENLGDAKENAKDIVNASQTLLEIVNGILDISKIEAGKIEIVNSKYNAPETFLELAKLITPKMNEKGLDFTYNIAPDLPETLFGDHANIKKIVTNLLSNACKYTEKGYVHYEVNCINSNGISKLIISVEDSGRGIKKENINKMFTKFQRLDEDKNTTIEGTGLGLAITKQLIELMGGRIILHTVYGEGSKFTVVINQKIEKTEVKTQKRVKTTLDLTNVRIMLVDDTPLNLKVASKLLEKYNANQIVTCSSGFECLDRIKRREVYDVILLDDMMPKMSGVKTLEELKKIPGFNIPTIALTANAITGMREKYLRDGFDDYLAKPIEKDQLIQVLNQVLGRNITEDIEIVADTDSPNIRGEEINLVYDIKKKNDGNEENDDEKLKSAVIPVENNIEEILGSSLDRNYQEKKLESNEESVEQLEDVNPMEIGPIETIPVKDITTTETFEKVYDRNYLESMGVDVNGALLLLGDMEMYNMTISDFMKEVESKWDRIVDYKNQNNMPDYAIEVHSLKSDCKYLGFMSLADIAYEHELKSKENDISFVNDNFERLESEYKKVLDIARTYVEHNNL